MTSIIVFGKPRGFESYEYIFEPEMVNEGFNVTGKICAYREPSLKPNSSWSNVLHYYAVENYAYYEYYLYAKGYEADRGGIVFGVSIKTDKNLKLWDTFNDLICPYFKFFKKYLLDDSGRFKTVSLVDTLQRQDVKWNDDDQQKINRINNNPQFKKRFNHNTLLLKEANWENINPIDEKIKEFTDVYIFDDAAILKDNQLLKKEANNKVYKIIKGEIVPLEKLSIEEENNHLKKELEKESDLLKAKQKLEAKQKTITKTNTFSVSDEKVLLELKEQKKIINRLQKKKDRLSKEIIELKNKLKNGNKTINTDNDRGLFFRLFSKKRLRVNTSSSDAINIGDASNGLHQVVNSNKELQFVVKIFKDLEKKRNQKINIIAAILIVAFLISGFFIFFQIRGKISFGNYKVEIIKTNPNEAEKSQRSNDLSSAESGASVLSGAKVDPLLIKNDIGTTNADTVITLTSGKTTIVFTPNIPVGWENKTDLTYTPIDQPSKLKVTTNKKGTYSIKVTPVDSRIKPKTIKLTFQ
jgi:hypothetical protein